MDTPQTNAPTRPDGTCCGQGGSWAPKPGQELVGGCQLCPASDTYWQQGRQQDGGPAPA